MWRRAKEGLNFVVCQLWKSRRRGSSNGDSEGTASELGEKSGNDDVLMAREWGLTKGVINHDKCYLRGQIERELRITNRTTDKNTIQNCEPDWNGYKREEMGK